MCQKSKLKTIFILRIKLNQLICVIIFYYVEDCDCNGAPGPWPYLGAAVAGAMAGLAVAAVWARYGHHIRPVLSDGVAWSRSRVRDLFV